MALELFLRSKNSLTIDSPTWNCSTSARPCLGLSTGFKSLDRRTAGLQPGSLTSLWHAGYGQTALALTIAVDVVLTENRPVQIFSMEMSREELTDRLLSLTAMVDLHTIRTGELTQRDWKLIAAASGRISNAPLHIDDRGTVTIAQLRRRARRAKAKAGVELVIVDYLQLMTPAAYAESLGNRRSAISRALKLLGKQLGGPCRGLVPSSIARSMIEPINDHYFPISATAAPLSRMRTSWHLSTETRSTTRTLSTKELQKF